MSPSTELTIVPSMISLVECSTGVETILLLPSETACSLGFFPPSVTGESDRKLLVSTTFSTSFSPFPSLL
uniref:Uncharacterized protein n=1 Tax=Arundo donax TaxID=35708 RepID=A0A0A9AXZ2_ARUDO